MGNSNRRKKPEQRGRSPSILFLMLTQFLLTAGEAAGAYFVYVSFESSNAIGVYQMDPSSGALELKTTAPVSGGPAPSTFSQDRKVMYVGQRPAKTISAFKVNGATGSLTLLNTIPAPENPIYLHPDNTGKYLLSAYYGGARMAIHPIGVDGKVEEDPVENRITGTNPHFIRTDPTNRFLYVPNTGSDKILQFSFDAATGKVQPLTPPEVTTASGAGPRHFTFHGTKDILYLVNEKNRSLTVYAMDPDKGTLSALQTLPTLPGSYSGTNSCADIHITPDNRFVYASNRGHQSLAGYRVDPDNGRLTAIGWFATPRTPRSFAIDPTGNFLFAAGQSADSLAAYRINRTTGELDLLRFYPTGDSPAWVLAVQLQDGSVSVHREGSGTQELGSRRPGHPESVEGRFHNLLGRVPGDRRGRTGVQVPMPFWHVPRPEH